MGKAGVTTYNGSLAQLGEHLLHTQGVAGPSPVVPTKRKILETINL